MSKDTIFNDEAPKKKVLSPALPYRMPLNYRPTNATSRDSSYVYPVIPDAGPVSKSTRRLLIAIGSCLLTYIIKGLVQNVNY